MVLFRIIVGFTHALDILSDFLMFLLPILAVRDLEPQSWLFGIYC
jgi:hypothetical protein